MKLKIITIVFLSVIIYSCKTKSEEKEVVTEQEASWNVLFNGNDLTGWDTYLGMPYKEGLDYGKQKEREDYKPFGLNNDPLKVFTVVTEDGKPAMRFSGEVWGGISTVNEYENYHLQMQFKWGDLKHAPRLNARRDSGLLYHAVGEQGHEGGFWMRSHELQVQEHDCGDYWGVAGTQMDIKAELNSDSIYQYNPIGKSIHFGDKSELGRHVIKYPDAEKPSGEWNTLDLYCYGTKSAHVVNGVLTMILENSRMVIDGMERPLTKGKIQLQVEGAELYYRNIKIETISKFPSF